MAEKKQKVNTYRKIVESAITLFQARGVEQVSIKEICEAADVTRNAFYYYFENRDLLFDAIADRILEQSRERVVMLYGQGEYYAQLWEFYRAFLLTELDIGPEIMNRIFLARTQKESSDYYAYSYLDRNLTDTMARLIEKAQENGQIGNRSDPKDLVWASYAIVRGVNVNWCFVLGNCDLIGDSQKALDLLFEPQPQYRLWRDGDQPDQG